jgi:hypothetical protein
MSAADLQSVADQVVRLARRQGYVVARDIQEELTRAGLPESSWKDVLARARPPLSYRRGRYHYVDPLGEPGAVPPRDDVQAAVERLAAQYRTAAGLVERREQGRFDFIQPVRVLTEDNRGFTLLTRDLSATGVRLIGTRRLLGQKVRVLIPSGEGTFDFTVRILWTCPVGDDLVENGGAFLSVTESVG